MPLKKSAYLPLLVSTIRPFKRTHTTDVSRRLKSDRNYVTFSIPRLKYLSQLTSLNHRYSIFKLTAMGKCKQEKNSEDEKLVEILSRFSIFQVKGH